MARRRKSTRVTAAALPATPTAAPVAAQATGVQPAGPSVTTARNQFDAAGNGRRMRGWRAPGTGPNRANAKLDTLRNRAQDATRNEWTGAAHERIWGTNLIGTGIVCRSNTKDADTKRRHTQIWNAFTAASDADGVLDFYGQQTLAVEAWRSAGEVFIRVRWRRVEDGLAVPVQIQLIEAAQVPVNLDADSWPGMPLGNRIRQGIELDRIGRRTAYWCYREHPGDAVATGPNHTDLVRVPAAEMRHLFKPTRPGQLRGVPGTAPVLPKMRNVGNFDDAVLERQSLANLYAMIIKRPPSTAAPTIDPTTGLPLEHDASGAPMVGLEPGISLEMAPGDDVTFSDPPDAGTNYPDFMRAQHLGIAAGAGTPYELLTGDIRDVSDRTMRLILNEFRRTCEQYQWQLIIPMLCRFAREVCGRAAVVAGLMPQRELADFLDVTWAPHAWPYIHPVQDVQSKKMEVDAKFRSRSSVQAERGEDPEEVDAEIAADIARERRLNTAAGGPDQ